MRTPAFMQAMNVEMGKTTIISHRLKIPLCNLTNLPCKSLSGIPQLCSGGQKKLLCLSQAFLMKGEINPQCCTETKMALKWIRVYIFFLNILTSLVHLCFIILEYNGIRNMTLDVVEGKTINIAQPSHKVPHAQTQHPHKYIPLLQCPQ